MFCVRRCFICLLLLGIHFFYADECKLKAMTPSGNYSTVSFAPCLRCAKVAETRPTVTSDLNIINGAAFRITTNQELTAMLISLSAKRFYLHPSSRAFPCSTYALNRVMKDKANGDKRGSVRRVFYLLRGS